MSSILEGISSTNKNISTSEQQDDIHVGAQIRDLRRKVGLTIVQLARQTGCSVGYISQIERSRSAITISTLQKIGAALGVQINWFFQGQARAPAEERHLIVRKANRRRIDLSEGGIIEELLSPTLSGQLELMLTTFKPGSWTGETDRIRKGEEAGYVIFGTLELHLDGKVFVLNEGDSFALPQHGSHRCHNPGDQDTVALWAISPPQF